MEKQPKKVMTIFALPSVSFFLYALLVQCNDSHIDPNIEQLEFDIKVVDYKRGRGALK